MKYLILTLFLLFPNASGYAGQTVRIGVLDTGLDINDPRFSGHICPDSAKDFSGTNIEDHVSHGSAVAGLITQYAKNKNYCFVIVKYTDTSDNIPLDQLWSALQYLSTQHLDVLNFSGGGSGYDQKEYDLFLKMKSVKIFVAAGNDHKNIDEFSYYPASYKLQNVTVVSSVNPKGNVAWFSNYSKDSVWEQGEDIVGMVPYTISNSGWGKMSGTSFSTAIATGRYVSSHY